MQYTFALAGNQNSGKTTLFNQLTGSSQHVGNWPGVTVEKKTGAMLHHHHGQQTHLGLPRRFRRAHENGQAVPDKYSDVTIVDLPGIYSLSPYSMEEIVSRNFIVREKPDVVINIVDATNLERNLYLTLQLLQLGRPVVVALNMMDEVRSHGDAIDLAAMEKGLGVPVVAICARKGEGLDELVRRAMDAAENHRLPPKLDICGGAAHKALHAIQHLVEQPAQAHGMTSRYAATKLFEGDAPMMEELDLSEDTRHIIEEILTAMEREVGMERAAVMADTRYRFIEKLLSTCYTRARRTAAPSPTGWTGCSRIRCWRFRCSFAHDAAGVLHHLRAVWHVAGGRLCRAGAAGGGRAGGGAGGLGRGRLGAAAFWWTARSRAWGACFRSCPRFCFCSCSCPFWRTAAIWPARRSSWISRFEGSASTAGPSSR